MSKPNIATANNLTRGQESAVLIRIAEQLGIEDIEVAVKVFLRGAFELVLVKILDMLGTVKISATTEKFVVKQKFVKDSKEVKFYGIWDNFTSWFLDGDGKIEEPVGEQVLSYGKLTKNSVDGLIIEELGGEEKVETTLSAIYGLLLKQPKGEEGALLTNGYANIFYVKDINGVLRAVNVLWDDYGWRVYVNSVGRTLVWLAGRRVFSGNS